MRDAEPWYEIKERDGFLAFISKIKYNLMAKRFNKTSGTQQNRYAVRDVLLNTM